MTNSKTTKKALLSSALALTMCVAMLIATTFAWFTDTASTSVNKIQAGTLDVDLEMKNPAYNVNEENSKEWISAEGETLKFRNASNSDKILWEPGATFNLDSFRIVNNGNLALKYKVIISGLVGSAKLLEAIDFTVAVEGSSLTAKDGTTSVPATVKALNNFEGTLGAEANTGAITISGTMDKNAGNEYQGLSIDGIGITVIATQDTAEFDSTTDQYDLSALYPVYTVADVETTVEGTGESAVTKVAAAVEIKTEETIEIDGSEVPVATAEVPKDVVLENGATQVAIDIKETNSTPSSITVNSAQGKKTLEVKLVGVKSTNNELTTVSYYIEKELTGLILYHNANEMTRVYSTDDFDAQDEYMYDETTGKLTFKSATFSPFTYVYDAPGTQTVTTENGLTEALSNKNIDTIKLGADITLSSVAEVNHDVTLDFNGKTLEAKIDGVQRAIDINACKLIFKDSSKNTDGKLVSAYGGVQLWGESPAFELKDITIECARSYAVQTGYTANAAVAVMKSGKIAGGAFNCNNRLWNGTDNNTVTIDGGEIDASNADANAGIYAGNCQTLTINNGKFICDGNPSLINIGSYNPYDGKWAVNVNGGTFTNNATDSWNKKFGKIIGASTKEALGLRGGTFNVNPSAYVAEGYTAVEDTATSTWTVSEVK